MQEDIPKEHFFIYIVPERNEKERIFCALLKGVLGNYFLGKRYEAVTT